MKIQHLSKWFDTFLVLVILVFMTLVVADTISSVPAVWPYLILNNLHNHLARFSLGLALLMALIAVYIGIIRKGDVTPHFRRGAYVIFGTVVVEALLGLAMYVFFEARPGQDVHLIYGLGTVLALPFFIFVETTAKKRPAMGSYIWGFILLAGIIVRGIVTGGS